jgi:hypothetical protein
VILPNLSNKAGQLVCTLEVALAMSSFKDNLFVMDGVVVREQTSLNDGLLKYAKEKLNTRPQKSAVNTAKVAQHGSGGVVKVANVDWATNIWTTAAVSTTT